MSKKHENSTLTQLTLEGTVCVCYLNTKFLNHKHNHKLKTPNNYKNALKPFISLLSCGVTLFSMSSFF